MCVCGGDILYSLRFSEIIQEEDGLKGPDTQDGTLPTDLTTASLLTSMGFIFMGLISHSSRFCRNSVGEAGVPSSSSKKLAGVGICFLYSS